MRRRDLMIVFGVVLGDWFLAEHVEIRVGVKYSTLE
jgi:hypothetical protein